MTEANLRYEVALAHQRYVDFIKKPGEIGSAEWQAELERLTADFNEKDTALRASIGLPRPHFYLP